VFAIVAAQSAGVPVPGTTALAAAAIYAGSTHRLAIEGVIVAAALGAVLGGCAGFAAGLWGGGPVLRRYAERLRLTPGRLEAGRRLLAQHGGKVILVGRFITGLRTWAGMLAGAGGMPVRRFLIFNLIGGVLWAVLNGLSYYYLGHALSTASTPVDVGLAILGLAWIGGSFAYLRRRAAPLAEPSQQQD
jgi:membrane protein DedA with SNARE-associated domain